MQLKDVQVTIGTKNIIATDASISEQNNISAIYFMGTKRADTTSPSGPSTNQFQINYIVEPENDINQALVNELRGYNNSSFPIKVALAGITGMGYIDSYNLNIEANEVVTASVTYNIYTPITGHLSNQTRTSNGEGKGLGVAHSWTSYAKMVDNSASGTILNLNYSFNPNFRPIYKIGSPYPVEVKFLGAEESFLITSEYDARILYSGQTFTGKFNDIQWVEIKALSGLWNANADKIYLYLDSSKIIANKIDIQPGKNIIQETTATRFY